MEYLKRKHFVDILILLSKSPKSFNELLKTLNAYPDTLNRRIKEMVLLGLITQIEEGDRIKYRLTDKGKRIIPLLEDLLRIMDEIEKILES